jgi:hypothetical protein
MLTNFRGKNARDTETAAESIINRDLKSILPESAKPLPKMTVTYQQQSVEGMDEYYGKKK